MGEDIERVRTELESDGYSILPALITCEEADLIAQAIGRTHIASSPGLRNLHYQSAEVFSMIHSPAVKSLMGNLFPEEPYPVRSIFFDKTPEVNWKVSWHQDLTIAVKEKKEVEGFGQWSIKDGIHHVQPPIAILQGMVTLRIHLDECHAGNGPLLVLPVHIEAIG